MDKYIELHRFADESLQRAYPMGINMGAMSTFEGCANGTYIEMKNEKTYHVAESYNQVKLLIGACQGGIPMNKELEKIRGLD